MDTKHSQDIKGREGTILICLYQFLQLISTEVFSCNYAPEMYDLYFWSQHIQLPDCWSMRFINLWELTFDGKLLINVIILSLSICEFEFSSTITPQRPTKWVSHWLVKFLLGLCSIILVLFSWIYKLKNVRWHFTFQDLELVYWKEQNYRCFLLLVLLIVLLLNKINCINQVAFCFPSMHFWTKTIVSGENFWYKYFYLD